MLAGSSAFLYTELLCGVSVLCHGFWQELAAGVVPLMSPDLLSATHASGVVLLAGSGATCATGWERCYLWYWLGVLLLVLLAGSCYTKLHLTPTHFAILHSCLHTHTSLLHTSLTHLTFTQVITFLISTHCTYHPPGLSRSRGWTARLWSVTTTCGESPPALLQRT